MSSEYLTCSDSGAIPAGSRCANRDSHRSAGGHELQPSDVNSSTRATVPGGDTLLHAGIAAGATVCATPGAARAPLIRPTSPTLKWRRSIDRLRIPVSRPCPSYRQSPP